MFHRDTFNYVINNYLFGGQKGKKSTVLALRRVCKKYYRWINENGNWWKQRCMFQWDPPPFYSKEMNRWVYGRGFEKSFIRATHRAIKAHTRSRFDEERVLHQGIYSGRGNTMYEDPFVIRVRERTLKMKCDRDWYLSKREYYAIIHADVEFLNKKWRETTPPCF